MAIEYIRGIQSQDESLLSKYDIREKKNSIDEKLIEQTLRQEYKEERRYNISSPSEIIVHISDPLSWNVVSKQEILWRFESMLARYEERYFQNQESNMVKRTYEIIYSNLKSMFDKQMKFEDWIFYFVWDEKSENFLNWFLWYLKVEYKLKVGIFSMGWKEKNGTWKVWPKHFLPY